MIRLVQHRYLTRWLIDAQRPGRRFRTLKIIFRGCVYGLLCVYRLWKLNTGYLYIWRSYWPIFLSLCFISCHGQVFSQSLTLSYFISAFNYTLFVACFLFRTFIIFFRLYILLRNFQFILLHFLQNVLILSMRLLIVMPYFFICRLIQFFLNFLLQSLYIFLCLK